MNVLGVITEHNPFHYGHLYHVQEAKKLAKADYVISIMSGNFLQRGEPALVNKWARARMALAAGVDLVIELPTAFATRSAPSFAYGAVKILHECKVVTHLCFGSEIGEIEPLQKLTSLWLEEPPLLSELVQKFLGHGIIYPLAQTRALKEFLEMTEDQDREHLHVFSASPNNILGVEYLKALANLNSQILPLTIKRAVNNYHDKDFPVDHNIASATSIRHSILEGKEPDRLGTYMPTSSFQILQEEFAAGRGPIFNKDLEQLILFCLRLRGDNLKGIVDVAEGLENRILKLATKCVDYNSLINGVKNKRYTWTRLQRVLLHHLLDFTQAEADLFQKVGPQYLRVLGFNIQGQQLLGRIKKASNLPLISKTASFTEHQGVLKAMLDLDIKATNLYSLLYPVKSNRIAGLDFLTSPIFDKGPDQG